MEKSWKLYILRCGDGSLYTGVAVDVEARLAMHRSGKGAKYTRGRGPLELMYTEECGTHSQALKREMEVKALSRAEKFILLQNQTEDLSKETIVLTDETFCAKNKKKHKEAALCRQDY